MFWYIATYFSSMMSLTVAIGLAGMGTAARALSKCVCAFAACPNRKYASARISSFSMYVMIGCENCGLFRVPLSVETPPGDWVLALGGPWPPNGPGLEPLKYSGRRGSLR